MTVLAGSRVRLVAMRRRQLLVSVSLLAGAFATYGRGAYAQQVCAPSGGTSYLCTGTSKDTQTITRDNASVEAGSPLVIETDPAKGGNGGNALAISGRGDIRFVSAPDGYVVLSGETNGLNIVSTGDIGTAPGSLLVDTSGYFVGRYGINATGYHGSGPTTIRFDGTAIGSVAGISARNAGGAGGLSVTAGENAYIEGGSTGLFATNFGGSAVIAVDGFVGSGGRAINVINGAISADLSIATGASSEVYGLVGITARHAGSGTARLDIGGEVTGTGRYGVVLEGEPNAGNLVITTAAGSRVTAAEAAIGLKNRGRGDSLIEIGGDVVNSHTFGHGVLLINRGYAGDATVITHEDSNIAGRNRGIYLANGATGVSTVSVHGKVSATQQDGIYVRNYGDATGIAITAGASAQVEGGKYGVNAHNLAGGQTNIVIDGDVAGTSRVGAYAVNGAGATDLAVTTGSQSTISGGTAGIWALNQGTGATTVTLTGDVVSAGEAIVAFNVATATDLVVTTAAGSTMEGLRGIRAVNLGIGATEVTIGGDVLGSTSQGIFLASTHGSRLSILEGATVTSQGTTVDADAIRIAGQSLVTVAGAVASNAGHAIRFDTTNAYDDRLELQPGWDVEGIVDAGLGLDTLAFGGSTSGAAGVDSTYDMTRVDIGGTGAPDADFFGFETFAKTGTSVFELTGSNSGVAEFAVTQGTLVLNADLAGMDLAVGSGGSLIGTGTGGSFAFGTGATVAPGTAGEIGVLTAQGPADFDAGSRFLLDIEANGGADRIVADTAAIGGGTVVVSAGPSNGVFVNGQRFVIVDATGGVLGKFDGIEKAYDSVFLDFDLAQTPTQVAVETNVIAFESAAATKNQETVARRLFTFAQSADPDAQSVYSSILFAPTIEDAQAAFDAASGEIHASLPTAIANAGIGFGQILRTRAGLPPAAAPAVEPLAYAPAPLAAQAIDAAVDPAAPDAAHGLWGQLMAGGASIAGGGTAGDLDLSFGGIAAGTEAVWSGAGFSAGLALGYTRNEASVASSQAAIDSAHVGVYGAMESGPLLLSAATHFGIHSVETSRDVLVGGVGGTAIASYGAQSLGISAAARYRLEVGGVTVSPFAGVDAAFVHSQGATETGAGVLNLSIDPADYVTGTMVAGLALGHEWQLDGEARLRTEVSAAYEHSLGGAPDRNLAFAGAPGYTLSGADLEDHRLALEAKLDLSFDGGLTFSGGYRGTFGADSTSHSGQLSISHKF
ncbi:MAG TPA: autotransporter domain-containing protein [Devosiaceae bacterium]|jgi:uncharacterized protein with beta-barrel porin domain|nr:autotransporter domain-containing protein [Devosiaceae bacterium]